MKGKGQTGREIINPTTKPIQQPRPRSKLCQNDFLFHFTEAVPCFITSEFMPYSWGSPLELVSCLVKVYTCYSHRQCDLKGKNILQVKYSHTCNRKLNSKALEHMYLIVACLTMFLLLPFTATLYQTQWWLIGGVAALYLPGASDEVLKS